MEHLLFLFFVLPLVTLAIYLTYHWWSHAKIEDGEYLQVLCHDEWKTESQIRTEVMEGRDGKWTSTADTYAALTRLEMIGLVEKRLTEEDSDDAQYQVRIFEFRLKPNCSRKRKREFERSCWAAPKPSFALDTLRLCQHEA
jgi:hypothetical protein